MSASNAPHELRLQIAVEVSVASDEVEGGTGSSSSPAAPPVSQLLEAARSLLLSLCRGLDIRIATLTRPGGVKLVAVGPARRDDLNRILAAAATPDHRPLPGQESGVHT